AVGCRGTVKRRPETVPQRGASLGGPAGTTPPPCLRSQPISTSKSVAVQHPNSDGLPARHDTKTVHLSPHIKNFLAGSSSQRQSPRREGGFHLNRVGD